MARRGRAARYGMRKITACFARALQRCIGRLYMDFLSIFQAIRPTGKTRNQLTVKLMLVGGTKAHEVSLFLGNLEFPTASIPLRYAEGRPQSLSRALVADGLQPPLRAP